MPRLKSATNPESGLIQYGYDSNGNLLTKTDARNLVTTFAYDNLNRVISRSYNDNNVTPAVSYFYDNLTNAKGKLIKVSSSVSTTEYTSFDNLGRVLAHKQTTDGQIYNTAYSYNLSGALIEETYPSGRVVKNVLDNDGDLSIVQSKKNANAGFFNYAKNFTYTAAGAMSSMQFGNGKWESTVFNSRLQPTQIALGTTQNGTDKLKLNFDYGTTANNGNVISQTITVPTVGGAAGFTATQSYNYDSLNRLKDATETISGAQSWKQTFLYDSYGNRNFDAANTTTLGTCTQTQCNPTVNVADNRFTSGQGYTYDLAGNVITDANGRTFTFDGENKQTKVVASGNTVGEYFYDGDGKRVKKVVGTETTVFVYDASGRMVAEYATTLSPTPQVSYLTSDHLGSPRITTDANGNVFSRRDFLPFGEELTSAQTAQRNINLNYGEDGLRQKFTIYERDNESDLDFAQARYYKSQHGRFTSADSFGGVRSNPQSFNRYSYVLNTPLKYNDPTGHTWEHPTKNREDKSDWYEPPQFECLCFREWTNQGGGPVWVAPEEFAKGGYDLWTGEMNYPSAEGQVTLDPRGPNPETPWGWTLDSVAVGDPTEQALPPSPPGENNASDTATSTPPMVMSSIGDPRRNWYLMYSDVHARRSRGQALFPDSRGLDAERHRWATRQTALQWGTGTARTFGVLNEIQGFIFHDLGPLAGDAARAYPSGMFISTRTQWAFQWSDLQHNERGINEANTIMNQPKNNVPK